MLRALFLFHTCRHQYPGTATTGTLCPQPAAVSDFPASTGRSSCTSPFSRLAQCSLTLRPACSPSHLVTLYTEGFSHFVTSMTAPITSGWSKLRRVGFAPTGKAPPFHGARRTPEASAANAMLLRRRRRRASTNASPDRQNTIPNGESSQMTNLERKSICAAKWSKFACPQTGKRIFSQ